VAAIAQSQQNSCGSEMPASVCMVLNVVAELAELAGIVAAELPQPYSRVALAKNHAKHTSITSEETSQKAWISGLS